METKMERQIWALIHTAKKGRIVIEYRGNEDLRRILEKIGIEA